jgi:uncharacterized protein YjiS (DUF1127 family)
MRIFSRAPAPHRAFSFPRPAELLATIERWWLAYIAWRIERNAVAQLSALSDRALKDIGLSRSEVASAVRNSAARDRLLSLYPARS